MSIRQIKTYKSRLLILIKVIVIMSGITVGRHHHLKTVAPQLLGRLDADLMGGLRRYFVRLKGLIAVVAHPAPQLAP